MNEDKKKFPTGNWEFAMKLVELLLTSLYKFMDFVKARCPAIEQAEEVSPETIRRFERIKAIQGKYVSLYVVLSLIFLSGILAFLFLLGVWIKWMI